MTIRSAAVVNGLAVVEGGNAPRAAPISWEGAQVTQANNGGNFAFQGGVPADCVGRLEDGVPADAVDVALANCAPSSEASAPLPPGRQPKVRLPRGAGRGVRTAAPAGPQKPAESPPPPQVPAVVPRAVSGEMVPAALPPGHPRPLHVGAREHPAPYLGIGQISAHA